MEDQSAPSTQQQHYNDNDADGGFGQETEEDVAGKMFIGGLSWQTTEQTLRQHFERYGELLDVALMYDKKTNKPRGFGFVKMKDPAAAEAVLHDEHTIDGRLVDVKLALPRDKAPGPASKTESCKIFVGGLPPEVNNESFAEYFNKFGVVKDAVVMVDRNSGTSRGFGFITFEQENTVNTVMQTNHEINGKNVEIKRAEPRDARQGAPGAAQDSYGGYGRRDNRRDQPGGQVQGRYGPQGGRGGMQTGGYGGAPGGYPQQGGYGGGRGNPYGGRYPQQPAGYGGAGYRGNPYTMPVPTGYGYAPGGPMPQVGYYGSAPAPAGYAGYGAGAGTAPPQGYGSQSGYGAPSARPDGQEGENKGAYDSSAIAAGYANAALQMRGQQQGYGYAQGGAPPQQYGYGYAAPQRAAPAADNSGAYKGQTQTAAESRAGRSYRPY